MGVSLFRLRCKLACMLEVTLVVPVVIVVPVLSWQLLRVVSTLRGRARATEVAFAGAKSQRLPISL